MNREPPTRTERQKNEILTAATEIFLDKGFDGSSTEEIATLAHVSKQTLYRHFPDKEALLRAVLNHATIRVEQVVEPIVATPKGAEAALTTLAKQLLEALLDPELLRLRRLVIVNTVRFPDIGIHFYDHGIVDGVLRAVGESFRYLSADSTLRITNPSKAAEHFMAMLLWDPVNRAMFSGERDILSAAAKTRQARLAVDVFLNGYAG